MTSNANSTHGFGLPLLSQPSCSSQRNPFISSPVKAGVPLGSVLGPVLFLIFINYLSDSLENPFCLFADDSTLCHDIPHTSDRQVAASSLPWDLYKITSLPNTWNMSFNPDKSHTLAISHWKDCLATLLFIPSHCFIQHIKCSFPLSLLGTLLMLPSPLSTHLCMLTFLFDGYKKVRYILLGKAALNWAQI